MQQLHSCEKFLFFQLFRGSWTEFLPTLADFWGRIYILTHSLPFPTLLRFELKKILSFTYTPKCFKSCTKVCNNHTAAKKFLFFSTFPRELNRVFTDTCGFLGENLYPNSFSSLSYSAPIWALKISLFTYTPKLPKSCTKMCNNHTITKNFILLRW